MKEKEIDYELTTSLVLEITDRIKLIMEYFPTDKNELLRHLAASSLHMTFFMRDIHDFKKGIKTLPEELEEEFLDSCGCKDKIEIK